jgi:hypothetical protein
VLWQQNRELAVSLRNQGLADCLAARLALRPAELNLFGQKVTFAHLSVSKSQQAVEKLTKGYLLWHSQSFDPTKGHSPFTSLLEDQPPDQRRALERLVQALNLVNKSIVREIKWLELLAPKPPVVPEADRGNLQPLHILQENTEYPFWSPAHHSLVTPANGITLLGHGVRAFKAARSYLTALGHSDPVDYCLPIREFLQTFSMSTEVTEWPPSVH